MRFRGGGIGHGYMRLIEPWLDQTGWGTTWPSLNHMEPNHRPDTDNSQNQMNIAAHQRRGDGDEDGGAGGTAVDESDEDMESEDGDGDDIEHPDDQEEEGDDVNGEKEEATPLNRTSQEGEGEQEDAPFVSL